MCRCDGGSESDAYVRPSCVRHATEEDRVTVACDLQRCARVGHSQAAVQGGTRRKDAALVRGDV